MKMTQMKSTLLAFCVLCTAMPLAAVEKTVSSWKDFRSAVNDSSVDVINVNGNFDLSRSISITRDLKIKSANANNIRTISNNNSYTFTISRGCMLELENIVINGNNNSHKADVFHLTAATSTNRIARLRLMSGAKIENFRLVTYGDADHAVVHVKDAGSLIIEDGAAILNCRNETLHGNGGAVCCHSGQVIMNGGVIAGCSAKGAGGAIRTLGTRTDADDNIGLMMRGDIYLIGGFITNNVCGNGASADAEEVYGGGIYLGGTGPMLHVIGPAVVSNNVCKAGGDVVADDVSTYKLHDDFANRLKLTTNASDIKFTNGWIGVRYPDKSKDPSVQVQSTRFGGVWEYETTFQDEARQFFWNGNNSYRGWMDGNALVWSRFHMHELPRDNMRIKDLLEDSDHSGGPLYVELVGDYQMLEGPDDHATVPDGQELIIDLQGFHLKCDIHVVAGGKVTILDSSTNRAGTVYGHRESEAQEGSDDWKTAFELQGGSYHTKPPAEWIAPGRVLIDNYCEEHPWMVARLAWETNLVSRLEDVTTVPLVEVDDEVRTVEMEQEDGVLKPKIGAITFSSGDWRRGAYTNRNLHAEILAAPAVRTADGEFEETGPRILLYSSNEDVDASAENPESGISALGREDAFKWTQAASASGLIKLVHITTKKVGATVTTNAVEKSYFQFPEAAFKATQRKSGAGRKPITLVDELLASLGYNRAAGLAAGEVESTLDTFDANGLRKWENIVTGTDENQLLLSTAAEDGNGLSLDISLVDADKRGRTDTGYHVRYDLRKSVNGAWTRVGEVMDEPAFSVPLLDGDGKSVGASGFYRVTTLIIPDNTPSVTNEIPSTNIVGVLEVASTLTNTLAAVPWVSLAADPATADSLPVTVSNYVHTAHLDDDDAVQVADKGHIYRKWHWDKGGKKWSGAITVTRDAVHAATDAEDHAIGRESAVWVKRGKPDEKPLFLIGQYSAAEVSLTIEGGSRENPVCTLVPNPCLNDVPVNSYPWGANPVKGDLVRIPNEKSVPLALSWNGSEWGRIVKVPGERYGRWKNDEKIPSGTGFWYMRCDGKSFDVVLPKSEPAQ